MISSRDRSGYFGASDAHYLTGNWNTNTFKNWWLVKLGLYTDDITTKAMKVGNAYEHKILKYLFPDVGLEPEGAILLDHQIILEDIKLRVNYDGIDKDTIYEVKTYSGEEFKLSKNYWRQAQVEMFALNEELFNRESKLYIAAYQVGESEYQSYFEDIDPNRLKLIPVEYDEDYIEEFLDCLYVLNDYLKMGAMPDETKRPNRDKRSRKRKSI